MNTIKIKKDSTRLVAHRGLSGIEAENTNAAFVAAGNRSYYGIETDIHRTSDGRFVVCHDGDLNRIAGVDMAVEDTDLSRLQEVVLLDKDGRRDREDLRLSTLENYLGICKKYDKHCVLELKSDFTDEEISRIVDVVKGFDYLNSVTFISFYYSNLTKIRNICPEQSVQFLFGGFNEDVISQLISDKIDVDVHHLALTEEVIARLHEGGLTVNCWTVDDPARAEELCAWGVDFITTNILE